MTQPQAGAISRYFAIPERGSSIRTEVLAGCTTFLTMAYIVLVNPAILGQAGMPVASVAAATCFAAAFASILMGLVANTPLALAPGMGLNAYFSFTVVQQMGVPWPVALGCVMISGLAFLVLTLTGVRQMIVAVIPPYLFAAVAGGIGLFIGFIGLKDAGIITASPATFVTLGNLKTPGADLALVGRVVIGAFVLAGTLSALAGQLLAGYANQAYQGMGNPYLMPTIAAVVVGGTSILGGRGSYAGTFAGALFITLLLSVLSVLQLPEAVRQILFGLIIMAMLVIDGLRRAKPA